MKKTIFIFGLLFTFAFLYAQNAITPTNSVTNGTEVLQRTIGTPIQDSQVELSVPATTIQKSPAKGNIFDGAEDHDDFALNSPGSAGWTYHIKPGSSYSVSGVTWPNVHESAIIIFNPSKTTPPMTQTAIAPRTGSKFFAIWGLSGDTYNDHWIVSPLLNAEGTFSFTFWAKSFNSMYAPELMNVRYSTTTNAKESFTNFLAGSSSQPVIIPAGSWTKYQYVVPASAKYVAIQSVSVDGWCTMIDDIEIKLVSNCAPVSDLNVTYTPDCKANLSWTGHGGAASYEIWRDNVKISTVTTNSYFDNAVIDPTRSHEWQVIAICPDENSAPLRKTLEACGGCPVVPNLALNIISKEIDCDAELTWGVPPSLQEGVIAICKGDDIEYDWEEGFPDDPENDFTFAFRYLPADFASAGIVSGQTLEKVFLQMGSGIEHIEKMQIRVWEGGNSVSGPGVEVITQDVDFKQFDENTGYWIALTNPRTIDVNKELRIGYRMTWPRVGEACMMVPYDKGPVVEEKGDLVNLLRGDFYIWLTSGAPYNYYIKAEIGKGTSVAPEWSYDIYKDGAILVPNYKENSFIDENIGLVQHSWMVKVNCTTQGQSIPSSKSGICKVGVNDITKTSFTIQPNPAKDNIKIAADDIFGKVEIVNFLGQTVVTQINDANYANINVSNLTNGVYFVRIISEKGTSVQKFVKQ